MNEKTKIYKIEIEGCWCCPHLAFSRETGTSICKLSVKVVGYLGEDPPDFPNWCKLEDTK